MSGCQECSPSCTSAPLAVACKAMAVGASKFCRALRRQDAHSKWPEVVEMQSTTSERTIAELRKLWLHTDSLSNLLQTTVHSLHSMNFATFLKLNSVKHVHCSSYHPASSELLSELQRARLVVEEPASTGKLLHFILPSDQLGADLPASQRHIF